MQVWPYSAQVPVGPPPPAPPSPPGGGVPQVPEVEPGGMTHIEREQQSALVVQAPSTGMQPSPHTNGGSPSGFGVQGRLQQSALVAQARPM